MSKSIVRLCVGKGQMKSVQATPQREEAKC